LPYSHPAIGCVSSLPPFSSTAVRAEKTYQWENELAKKNKGSSDCMWHHSLQLVSAPGGYMTLCLLSLLFQFSHLKTKFNSISVFQ